jgi:uncharacterized protein (DUF433 family)
MAGTDFTTDAEGAMPRIVKTEGVLGGEPRLEGHRIGVYHLYQRYVEGDESPETIAASFDLTVGEVHAALAYAFSNPDEMDAIEARNRMRYEEAKEVRIGPDDFD